MKTQARVVVVGGGIVGVSILYHLAKMGWSDVVLCERTELTAGSTWHAAGLLPLFNLSYSIGKMHQYSVGLYKTLEAETGQDVSFHACGNLRVATNQDRMDEYQTYCGTAHGSGVNFEILSPAEVKALWPFAETSDMIGALFHPDDGHIASADLTNALAIGARQRGAKIYRHTAVTSIAQKANGEWLVHTDKGDIACEHVVTATGNYARQTGAMVGLDLPAIPICHQYIVTDSHPAIVERHHQGLPEMPILRIPDGRYYLRQEHQGLIFGCYEKGAPACFVDGVPDSFGQDLFPSDIDRLQPHIEAAMERAPIFAEVGLKDVINGPIMYTPDGAPLIGPAWGLKNYWLSEGHSFGITAAGGAGKYLAEWIINGEPSIDLLDVDPRRFGAYADKDYAKAKNEEAYEHVFIIHYPDEERPACRPAKTSPCYERMESAGAVWGQDYGWERPNWFASDGVERRDVWSFRRTNYFEPVGHEARLVREAVGLMDLTPLAKFELSGPGAEAYLDRLVANALPGEEGQACLAHALTQTGGVRSEFVITRLGAERFYLTSASRAERFDLDLLQKNLSGDESVRLENQTDKWGVFLIAGPRSRDLLQAITDQDLSNEAFPWFSARQAAIGIDNHIRALRISYVGELGWELHHPIEAQNHIYDVLLRAGQDHGLGLVGMRAINALRIEKSYRAWGRELSREYNALETGLDTFVQLDKGEFVGRKALVQQKQQGKAISFATLEVWPEERAGRGVADCRGNEPLFKDGQMVGRCTSGTHSHNLDKSLALAYVEPDHCSPGTDLEVEILGQRFPAKVIGNSPWDPENRCLRS
ncbi:MAG: FAD-dependent oxidoreductase [Pseudomonadota bacterium]